MIYYYDSNDYSKKMQSGEKEMNKMYTELAVRYAETDQMGIVHHSVYPIWFEAGRSDFMEKIGYPYWKMESEGVMTPMTKLECSFREGAKYGDTVVISTWIKRLTAVRIEICYSVTRKNDGTLLAEGSTVLAWTDKAMHIINLKKKNPALYETLEKLTGE